jgi:hypothetical protein
MMQKLVKFVGRENITNCGCKGRKDLSDDVKVDSDFVGSGHRQHHHDPEHVADQDLTDETNNLKTNKK